MSAVGRRDFAGHLLLAAALHLRLNVLHAVRAHRNARRLAMTTREGVMSALLWCGYWLTWALVPPARFVLRHIDKGY